MSDHVLEGRDCPICGSRRRVVVPVVGGDYLRCANCDRLLWKIDPDYPITTVDRQEIARKIERELDEPGPVGGTT